MAKLDYDLVSPSGARLYLTPEERERYYAAIDPAPLRPALVARYARGLIELGTGKGPGDSRERRE